MKWELLVIILITVGIIIRIRRRKYFWKDKKGKKLTFKQFIKRWKEGVEGTTPLQQTKTTLWSFPLLYGGIIWGLGVTLMAGTYWMALILGGSLPITSMQLLSTWQKYKTQKKIDDLMKNATPIKQKKK